MPRGGCSTACYGGAFGMVSPTALLEVCPANISPTDFPPQGLAGIADVCPGAHQAQRSAPQQTNGPPSQSGDAGCHPIGGCSAALVVMAGQRRCSEGCGSEADLLACASAARKVRPERHWFARARYPYGSGGTASQHSCTRTFATMIMTCPVGSRVFRSAGCTV